MSDRTQTLTVEIEVNRSDAERWIGGRGSDAILDNLLRPAIRQALAQPEHQGDEGLAQKLRDKAAEKRDLSAKCETVAAGERALGVAEGFDLAADLLPPAPALSDKERERLASIAGLLDAAIERGQLTSPVWSEEATFLRAAAAESPGRGGASGLREALERAWLLGWHYCDDMGERTSVEECTKVAEAHAYSALCEQVTERAEEERDKWKFEPCRCGGGVLSAEERDQLRKAAQLLKETTEGPDPYADDLIGCLRNLASQEHRGEEPALRRERAVTELLALAAIADSQRMREELEALAARFSLPPLSSDPSPGEVGKLRERLLSNTALYAAKQKWAESGASWHDAVEALIDAAYQLQEFPKVCQRCAQEKAGCIRVGDDWLCPTCNPAPSQVEGDESHAVEGAEERGYEEDRQPEPGDEEDWPEVELVRIAGTKLLRLVTDGATYSNAHEFRRYLPATSQDSSGLEAMRVAASMYKQLAEERGGRAERAETALEELVAELNAEAKAVEGKAKEARRARTHCPEHGELCGRPNWTGYCCWRVERVEEWIEDYDNALASALSRVETLEAELSQALAAGLSDGDRELIRNMATRIEEGMPECLPEARVLRKLATPKEGGEETITVARARMQLREAFETSEPPQDGTDLEYFIRRALPSKEADRD